MAPDDPLTDDALQEEIALVGALVIEATASDGPMDQDDIDAILGVEEHRAAPDEARSEASAEGRADGDGDGDAGPEDAGS